MSTCQNPRPCLRLICFACLFIPGFLNAAIIYVNPSAVGTNNGTSWTNAYTSLSTALQTAVGGDEIWVKQGVYKPLTLVDVNNSGGTEAREATFSIPSGVALYGGFLGTEMTRDARNANTNVTILSGDIDNNDANADANFIAENTGNIVGNNAYHVIYTVNASASTRVDGFTITAGNAMSAAAITDANQDGGGWYNRLSGGVNASSPTIINTTFRGNYAASEGGALYCTNGTAGAAVLSLIQNCKFISNKSNVNGGAINMGSFTAGNYQPQIRRCEFTMNEAYRRGGAIYFIGDHAILDSCLFSGNQVTAVSPNASTFPGLGGGVGMVGTNAVFNHCIFKANSSTGNPTGPFENGGGGAVYMSTNESQTITLGISEPKFISCGFYSNIASGNTSSWGGAAVHLSDGGKLSPQYVNCVFAGNQAQDDGGAVANFIRIPGPLTPGFMPFLKPVFTNCTFSANHAGKRGGAMYNDGYVDMMNTELLNARIENSILWNNTATTSGPEVFNSGINLVAYSLVKGSGGSGGGWNSSIGTDGGNNIDVNPGFLNEGDPDGADNIAATTDDGLNLTPASPPVDAGNNAAAGLAGINTDYVSAARIQGSKVDMGAYERAGVFVPGGKIYWLKDWAPYKPVCFVCPWAFLLSEKLAQHFIWDGPAQLIEKGDSAIITGHIVDRGNKNIGFEVYLKLVNKHDWKSWSAKGRTYIALTIEAILTAWKNHPEWTYYELSDQSFLKGTGDLSGQINLSHLPPNYKIGFQLGEGANGWDKDFGMSGSFSYKGTLKYKGSNLRFKGIGSMNVDAQLCKKDCTPLINVPFSTVQHGTRDVADMESGPAGLSVYPVPAYNQLTISAKSLPAGMYTLRVYNSLGQLKKQQSVFINQNNVSISVRELAQGAYILQLTDRAGKLSTRKFVVE